MDNVRLMTSVINPGREMAETLLYVKQSFLVTQNVSTFQVPMSISVWTRILQAVSGVIMGSYKGTWETASRVYGIQERLSEL